MDRLQGLDSLVPETIDLPLGPQSLTMLRYREYMGIVPYTPALAPIPSSPLDDEGLSVLKQYVSSVKQTESAAPELVSLLDLWLEFSSKAIQSPNDDGEQLVAQARATVIENAIRLWWSQVHQENGLVYMLREQSGLLKSLSLVGRFGDYTSETLKGLKQDVEKKSFVRPLLGGKDWVEVEREIKSEEDLINRYANAGTECPAGLKPWHVDLDKAASCFNNVSQAQLIGEIRFYALRNIACHSGIGRLIQKGEFDDLAHRIAVDKSLLEKAFQDYPEEKEVVESCMTRLAKVCYDELEAKYGVITRMELSEKAKEKVKKILRKQKPSQGTDS